MEMKKIIAKALALTLCVSSAAAFAEEAQITELDGSKYVVAQDAWNVDFEGEHVASHRWGAPYVEVKDSATSATLTNSLGNAIIMHTGSTNNSITTEDTGDEAHGTALKFVANDDNQVQINEGATTASGDVLAYEWDYMLSALPSKSNAVIVVMQPVLQSSQWLSALTVVPDATSPVFSAKGETMPIQLNTWYNIKCYADFTKSKMSYYINDTLLLSVALASGAPNTGQKVVALMAGASGGVMWIDNFRHYSLKALPRITSIKTDGKLLDIEFSQAVPVTEFVKDDAVSNVTVAYNGYDFELVKAQATLNPKVLRFEASTAFPTAVPLDISMTYVGVQIGGEFESTTAKLDMKGVTVTKAGSTFTATATVNNALGVEDTVVIIVALYDAEGAVVGMKYQPAALVNNSTVTASVTNDNAVSAKVFFMNGWEELTPFKNIYYMSK